MADNRYQTSDNRFQMTGLILKTIKKMHNTPPPPISHLMSYVLDVKKVKRKYNAFSSSTFDIKL
jgi:hypothetical protein